MEVESDYPIRYLLYLIGQSIYPIGQLTDGGNEPKTTAAKQIGVYLKAGRFSPFLDLRIPPKPYQIGHSRDLADILALISFPA